MTAALGPEPTIWLGAQQINGVAAAGVAWVVEGIDGWYGSAAPTLAVVQRGADDGGWGGSSWLTPKIVTLTVTMTAAVTPLLLAALDTLTAAASLAATPLRVLELSGLDRTVTVRRNGEVLAAWEGSGGTTVTVSIPLVAEDPRKYSTTAHTGTCNLPSVTGGLTFPVVFPAVFNAVVSSGSIQVANAGTIACAPLLRIYGPVQQPIVTLQRSDGTIQQLTYNDTLGASDYLDLDCSAHTCILDGSASRRGSLAGDWPMIPPGSAAVLAFAAAAPSPTAQLTATWWDTWM